MQKYYSCLSGPLNLMPVFTNNMCASFQVLKHVHRLASLMCCRHCMYHVTGDFFYKTKTLHVALNIFQVYYRWHLNGDQTTNDTRFRLQCRSKMTPAQMWPIRSLLELSFPLGYTILLPVTTAVTMCTDGVLDVSTESQHKSCSRSSLTLNVCASL